MAEIVSEFCEISTKKS